MRLDEVYGMVAAFDDEELRAFVDADRLRRGGLERAADRVFLGWLVRLFAPDPLTAARVRASAAVRAAGLPVPHPTWAATRALLPPLGVLLAVFAATNAFGAAVRAALATNPMDRVVAGDSAVSFGLGVGALFAAMVARELGRAGPRNPGDVFGHRLNNALAPVYLTTAALALLPELFVAVVMAIPDLADLASLVYLGTGLACLMAGIRFSLRTRALNGVWRPFEDAALAAVAHGQIDELDEWLLTKPLRTVVERSRTAS